MATENVQLLFTAQTPKGKKFGEVRLKQISGRTNKACMNVKNFSSGKTVTKVLMTLIDKIVLDDGEELDPTESIVDSITSYDRHGLIIDAWKATYGKDDWKMVHQCSACENNMAVGFQFKEKRGPGSNFSNKKKHNGFDIEFKLPDGVTEGKVAKSMEQVAETEDLGEVYQTILDDFCSKVDGDDFSFDDASAPQINAVDELSKSLKFGYDTGGEVECPKCGAQQDTALPVSEMTFLFDRPGNLDSL